MTTLPRSALALALACALIATAALPAQAGDASLTLYRSDNNALYSAGSSRALNTGHAIVREQRSIALAAGRQQITLGDLPRFIDPEAIALDFGHGDASVLAQRLRLPQGNHAALDGLIGRNVDVLGNDGQPLASGTLLRVDNGLLLRDASGNSTLVDHFAAVRVAGGDFPVGSSLLLQVDAKHAGDAQAVLSYPTGGLGWRAAYVATLQPGDSCRMQFDARASIANRSGRDWKQAQVVLIAGAPNFGGGFSGPRPLMMAARMMSEPVALPTQASAGDYRSFTLPAPVDLPNGSVSEVPLYAPRSLGCVRTALYENGNTWLPQAPILNEDYDSGGGNTVTSTLRFTAFDTLPAGRLRVLARDAQGMPQFAGEGELPDTPKGSDASIALGTVFDLRVARERTAFHLDQAARTLDEAFRLSLSNAGDAPRVVTVREHPSRWRDWTLVSSSLKPARQTANMLEFNVEVPANGHATLDYAVRYQWTADQAPH